MVETTNLPITKGEAPPKTAARLILNDTPIYLVLSENISAATDCAAAIKGDINKKEVLQKQAAKYSGGTNA